MYIYYVAAAAEARVTTGPGDGRYDRLKGLGLAFRVNPC